MIKLLFKFILKLKGWKITHYPPPGLQKFVMIIAPHTSMWDFIWGRLILTVLGLRVKFLIKQEVFWFPIGILLKAMGGLPVDRKRGSMMIHQVVEELEKAERLVIVITPEGTRAKTSKWKKGFYRIAEKAGVPVGVGFLDYKTMTCGVSYTFQPSGDFENDFRQIAEIYIGKEGKHSDRFAIPQ